MTEETGRYRTPGELVQAACEEQGLTLKDLATETRIPLRMLEAIQADDFAAISSPLYARSFLKSVGEELHLDIDLLLDRYDRLTEPDDVAPEIPEELTWETETRVVKTESYSWTRIIVMVCIVVSSILLLWGAVSLFRGGDDGDIADTAAVDQDAEPDTHVTSAAAAAAADSAFSYFESENLLLPPASPALEFAAGRTCPFVLRLVSVNPVDIVVQVDGVRTPDVIDWGDTAIGVPESGISPGRVYRVGVRYLIYWCAEDRIICNLDNDSGVELTMNGQTIDFLPHQLGRDRLLTQPSAADSP